MCLEHPGKCSLSGKSVATEGAWQWAGMEEGSGAVPGGHAAWPGQCVGQP